MGGVQWKSFGLGHISRCVGLLVFIALLGET